MAAATSTSQNILSEYGFQIFKELKPQTKKFLSSFYHPNDVLEASRRKGVKKIQPDFLKELKSKTGNPNFHVYLRVRPLIEREVTS